MLDPWIIEEIRKREDRERRDERPILEVPLEKPEPTDSFSTARVSISTFISCSTRTRKFRFLNN